MVTRRCSERRFFLRPSALTNLVFQYCLAYAAEQTGVALHAWVAMSNHWHAVVTDPEARLPEFMAHVNKLVGKCINASLGRWESLWSPEKFSAVALEDEDAVLDKLLYVLGNPVEASLVASWRQWPGAISGPRACASEPRRVLLPEVFFREDGGMPKALRLRATVPPCFSKLGPKRFAAKLAAGLKAHEAQLRKDNAAKGLTILGRKAVLDQDPFERPESYDPRRGLNPRIACKDKWRRIEALGRRKEFLEAYRKAWEWFKEGKKDVVFPEGTYWMCRHAGCECTPPG
jgi:REP element-mobilizing transposase RayT